eukprot:CFRG2322T1
MAMVCKGIVATGTEYESNVQVVVRCRVRNETEKKGGHTNVVKCNARNRDTVDVMCPNGLTATFAFDNVFGPTTTQHEVYQEIASDTLGDVLRGYDCTIFAYGQTGSGKTYTMLGEKGLSGDWTLSPHAGLIPRVLNELFGALERSLKEFTVSVSFLELHNNKLLDLLVLDDRKPPKMMTNADGNDVMIGMEKPDVNGLSEAYKVLAQGLKKRKVASTKMNSNSSRSHTIFTVYVDITETNADGEEIKRNGSLNLVDLGGSENIERSGAVNARAREAGNINQDLVHLGTVIRNLVEGGRPLYRGKELTRLLKNSLGGRAKTKFIATISPASSNVEETLRTLEYCFTAKNVKNRPELNATCTNRSFLDEEDEHLYINKYEKEIIKLRKDLHAAREQNGVYIALDSYNEEQLLMETLRKENEELHSIFDAQKKQYEDEKDILVSQLIDMEERLESQGCEMRKQDFIMKQRQLAEQKLFDEASQLRATVTYMTEEMNKLQQHANKSARVATSNLGRAKDLNSAVHRDCDQIKRQTDSFSRQQIDAMNEFQTLITNYIDEKNQKYEGMSNTIRDVQIGLKAQIHILCTQTSQTLQSVKTTASDIANDKLTAHVKALAETAQSAVACMVQEVLSTLAELSTESRQVRIQVESESNRIAEAVMFFGTTHSDQLANLNRDLDGLLSTEKQKLDEFLRTSKSKLQTDKQAIDQEFERVREEIVDHVSRSLRSSKSLTMEKMDESERMASDAVESVIGGVEDIEIMYGRLLSESRKDVVAQAKTIRASCSEMGNTIHPHLDTVTGSITSATTKLGEIQTTVHGVEREVNTSMKTIQEDLLGIHDAIADTITDEATNVGLFKTTFEEKIERDLNDLSEPLKISKEDSVYHKLQCVNTISAAIENTAHHQKDLHECSDSSIAAAELYCNGMQLPGDIPLQINGHYQHLSTQPLTRSKPIDVLTYEFEMQQAQRASKPSINHTDKDRAAVRTEPSDITIMSLDTDKVYSDVNIKRVLQDTGITPQKERPGKRLELNVSSVSTPTCARREV